MLDAFTIHQPGTVAEASRLLAEHGSHAAVYAGGTELLVIMKERLVHFPLLIDIKTIPGLNEIRIEGDRSNVILDGEIFQAKHGMPIILTSTQPVPFLRLAA